MKTTKNFKALENVLNDCSNMGDTLFAIYGVKGASESKKGGQLFFTGDHKIIADGMVEVIRKSLSDDVDNGSIAIANALLNAIATVLSRKDAISLQFAELLKDVIDTASKRRFGKKIAKKIKENAYSSIHVTHDDFDPKSRDCQECEDFAYCLMRELNNQAEKRGIDMITIQTNYKGRARKTKKANKNDEK